MNINWLLISEIHSGLSVLEKNCKWDLDNFEYSKLIESFYNDMNDKDGNQFTMANWLDIFERAYVNCYGEDHECDAVSFEEVCYFVGTIQDYFDRDYTKYKFPWPGTSHPYEKQLK